MNPVSSGPLSLAYSPCPNDTFIFHALVNDRIDCGDISFSDPVLDDVETLNRWAMRGRMDVTKLSFHAFGHLAAKYFLLRSGSALGRGCGPLLVAGPGRRSDAPANWRIGIPGRYTTAAMLLRLFTPGAVRLVETRFERIIPQVAAGELDAGVIIHESRFTYQASGLELVCDLGKWWESETGLPIPLGGIAVRRDLGPATALKVEDAVRASLEYAFTTPEASRDYIAGNAQEIDPGVIRSHIDLYVNRFSLGLGEEGEAAVREFLGRGEAAGFLPSNSFGIFPLL